MTRTIRIVHDVAEIEGVDRDIWLVVLHCPVNGAEILGEYHTSRAEAARAICEMTA